MSTFTFLKYNDIMKVVRKMNDILETKGIYDYQQTINRINHLLLSITRNADLLVSDFNFENNFKLDIDEESN